MITNPTDFHLTSDENTGVINSVRLFGVELLRQPSSGAEVRVNGQPLSTRVYPTQAESSSERTVRMKGEMFINHLTGYSLVVTREMGSRPKTRFGCYGIQYWVRREIADLTYPAPGPGGPVVEAPLWVDSLSLLNLDWSFWGNDTRMIFPSSYSAGPCEEWGHIGYEHDTPERCKKYLGNIFRRIYPGGLVIHGGVFYNQKTGHWIAITCRRPHLGYVLNISDAGQGVSYDFKLHAPVALGELWRMPEIKIYYGQSQDEMERWMADYATFYYEEPPEWTYKTLWGGGLAWNNEATWTEQADTWERELDRGEYNGIWINLVTNRPVWSGTSPIGYEPDPNHGTLSEFCGACQRIAERRTPFIIWMSHSGLLPGAPEVDNDWFIRGSDGRMVASWGNADSGMMYINPGHPGYMEYTRKWIRFYIQECGAAGIFFDCLGFPIPPDFSPRSFMRFPGDTGVMAIRFMEEMYRFIKECDPKAVMIGEGASLDGPVEMFSIITNPRRGIDGFGPRDYLLNLNHYASKKMVVYHSIPLFPGSGYCCAAGPGWERHNQYLLRLLKERGGRGAFIPLPGDLSVMDDLLFVPIDTDNPENREISASLLACTSRTVQLIVEEITGAKITISPDGTFQDVPSGIYRMK